MDLPAQEIALQPPPQIPTVPPIEPRSETWNLCQRRYRVQHPKTDNGYADGAEAVVMRGR
jgi:hypothetical protein